MANGKFQKKEPLESKEVVLVVLRNWESATDSRVHQALTSRQRV